MKPKVLLLGGSGYVGSMVFQELDINYEVNSVDLGWFGCPQPSTIMDYNDLENISDYESIICLAGHSSVPFCQNDPVGSYINNVTNLENLALKLTENQKLIYASSASVYGVSEKPCKESDRLVPGLLEYDKQKQLIEERIKKIHKNYYALRFATVNGYSINPRNELMINSMVRSAFINNKISVANSNMYRAILGLKDLVKAIEAILKDSNNPGSYNLASFNTQIGTIAKILSIMYNSPIEEGKPSSPYSFQLDTSKFESTFNFKFKETVESIAEDVCKNDFAVNRDWNIKYLKRINK